MVTKNMIQTLFNNKNKKELRRTLRNGATPQEIILWARLRKSQVGAKFRRQESIGHYVVDFYCPNKKLIIEIDGSQHKDEKQKIYDRERTVYLRRLGFKVLRFWNNDINNNISGVMLKINDYLQ